MTPTEEPPLPNQTTNHYSTISTVQKEPTPEQCLKEPLIDEEINNYVTIDTTRNVSYIPLSTTLTLKQKRHMFYFPMDFGELTIDGLIDTGALTSAVSEADLNKIKLLSSDAILDTGPPPNFQIMVANGQLENPIGTVQLKFEVADMEFRERFIIMKLLRTP